MTVKRKNNRLLYRFMIFIMRYIIPIICILVPILVSLFIGYKFYDGMYFDISKILLIALPVFIILETLSLLFIFRLITLMKKYNIIK